MYCCVHTEILIMPCHGSDRAASTRGVIFQVERAVPSLRCQYLQIAAWSDWIGRYLSAESESAQKIGPETTYPTLPCPALAADGVNSGPISAQTVPVGILKWASAPDVLKTNPCRASTWSTVYCYLLPSWLSMRSSSEMTSYRHLIYRYFIYWYTVLICAHWNRTSLLKIFDYLIIFIVNKHPNYLICYIITLY